MTDNYFVDTNILVYARDSSDPIKQQIAITLLEKLWRENSGKISSQVCNEYYVTVTGKLNPGLSKEEAWDDLRLLFAWNPAAITIKTLGKAREIEQLYGLSWWDSLIISSAWETNSKVVYSEDLNHEQKYSGITVINPFVT